MSSELTVAAPPPTLTEPTESAKPEPRTWLRWARQTLGSVGEWGFGLISGVAILALLASIPILCLLAFGYLLEVAGRVSRTGKLREAFFGVRPAARIGALALGIWLVLLPLRLTGTLVEAAQLIGQSTATNVMGIAHVVLSVVLLIHIAIAYARGGRLRHFLWPFPAPWKIALFPYRLIKGLWNEGPGYPLKAPRAVCGQLWSVMCRPWTSLSTGYLRGYAAFWEFVDSLHLPYYFSLGLRGLLATWVWLVIPVTMLANGNDNPVAGWIGAIILWVVVLYLPFLQTRFAAENRIREMFSLQQIRHNFKRAPFMYFLAVASTLLFSIPLYLLYIEYPPQDILWLPGIFFVVFLFPTRMVAGWAEARAQLRASPCHWAWRWFNWLLMLPVSAFYVLVVFFAQYVTQDGRMNLYDQHAFVIPFLNF